MESFECDCNNLGKDTPQIINNSSTKTDKKIVRKSLVLLKFKFNLVKLNVCREKSFDQLFVCSRIDRDRVYMYILSQSADPNLFKGTHCTSIHTFTYILSLLVGPTVRCTGGVVCGGGRAL